MVDHCRKKTSKYIWQAENCLFVHNNVNKKKLGLKTKMRLYCFKIFDEKNFMNA